MIAPSSKGRSLSRASLVGALIRACHLFSTLDQAYGQFIASMIDACQDHLALADSFSMQVTDELRATSKRHEESKKKQMQYFQKLLAERDRVYSERVKVRLGWRNVGYKDEPDLVRTQYKQKVISHS